MVKDIIIYIGECPNKDIDNKKYNATILKVMEGSGIEYDFHPKTYRAHGMSQIELHLENGDYEEHKVIARGLVSKLKSQGINIKNILDFRGKSVLK